MALVLGLLTAIFGVVFAAVRVDMKRLLACSSIENIGLIDRVWAGGRVPAYEMRALAALAMAAMSTTA